MVSTKIRNTTKAVQFNQTKCLTYKKMTGFELWTTKKTRFSQMLLKSFFEKKVAAIKTWEHCVKFEIP